MFVVWLAQFRQVGNYPFGYVGQTLLPVFCGKAMQHAIIAANVNHRIAWLVILCELRVTRQVEAAGWRGHVPYSRIDNITLAGGAHPKWLCCGCTFETTIAPNEIYPLFAPFIRFVALHQCFLCGTELGRPCFPFKDDSFVGGVVGGQYHPIGDARGTQGVKFVRCSNPVIGRWIAVDAPTWISAAGASFLGNAVGSDESLPAIGVIARNKSSDISPCK